MPLIKILGRILQGLFLMVSVWQLNFDSIGIKVDIWMVSDRVHQYLLPIAATFFHSTLILESFPIIGILLYYRDPSLLYL